MRTLLVVSLVVLLLGLSLAAYAQGFPPGGGPPGGGPQGGGPGGGGFGGMRGGMGMGMGMAPPAVMTFEGFIYVILGNVIYKVDPQTVQVVGATFLIPPGMGQPGPGLPPPPPG